MGSVMLMLHTLLMLHTALLFSYMVSVVTFPLYVCSSLATIRNANVD